MDTSANNNNDNIAADEKNFIEVMEEFAREYPEITRNKRRADMLNLVKKGWMI